MVQILRCWLWHAVKKQSRISFGSRDAVGFIARDSKNLTTTTSTASLSYQPAHRNVHSNQQPRALTVVTGGSRGFGAAFARQLLHTNYPYPCSHHDLVLVATSKQQLQEFCKQLQEIQLYTRKPLAHQHAIPVERRPPATEATFNLIPFAADLSDLGCLEQSATTLLQCSAQGGTIPVDPHCYSHVLLLNNAGTVGQLAYLQDQSFTNIHKQINLNITSYTYLVSLFLRTFIPSPKCQKVTVVNISSVSSHKPFEHFGIYALGKAARHMVIRTVALEAQRMHDECMMGKPATCSKQPLNTDLGDLSVSPSTWIQSTRAAEPHDTLDPHVCPGSPRHSHDRRLPVIRAFSYAPGPIDTDMQTQARINLPNGPLKAKFEDNHSQKRLVNPDEAARRLVQLLLEDKFENGSEVDYFQLTPTDEGVHPLASHSAS